MKKKIDLQDILENEKRVKSVGQKKSSEVKLNIKKVKTEPKENAPVIENPEKQKANQTEQRQSKTEENREILPNLVKIKQVNEMLEKKDKNDTLKDFVTFLLKNEEYAIDSDFVRQIIKYKKPIDIGIKSDLFFGITDVKDGVLPLVDFKIKFGMSGERKEDGSIIILQIDDLRVGVYVDYLVGITRFKESDIKQIPPFLPEKQLTYISGIGIKETKVKKIIIILNHLNLFSREDIKELKKIPEMYK
ncbi:MAG: hypothetical protein COX48_05085 [bacterium (Candidatus Stahlbacteria) CG23_combo_of_CG06-09_8_20_14_all_34_7]|nr:MAG: hypothetical protein COX48_05085 [bacterium (Candidatus Stahlbacteria) CG23_combo_of_CG06-09_8_20_14_all_34_7]